MFGPVTPVRPRYINPTNLPVYYLATTCFYGHASGLCMLGPILFYLPYFYDSTLYITLHVATGADPGFRRGVSYRNLG